MGLKSVRTVGFYTLGTREITVELIDFKSLPDAKKSLIVRQTSFPIIFQEVQKKFTL